MVVWLGADWCAGCGVQVVVCKTMCVLHMHSTHAWTQHKEGKQEINTIPAHDGDVIHTKE